MDKLQPTRFEPKNLPDDFVEDSLHRQAVRVNEDDTIPVVFGADALQFLLELASVLPRQGYSFITVARELVPEMAIGILPTPTADIVRELKAVLQRQEDAIACGDFDTARVLRDRKYELRDVISKIQVHEISPLEIKLALGEHGVDLDNEVKP